MAQFESEIRGILQSTLAGKEVDEDIVEYLLNVILSENVVNEENLIETLSPFLISYEIVQDDDKAKEICHNICNQLVQIGMIEKKKPTNVNSKTQKKEDDDAPSLLNKVLNFSDLSKSRITDTEQAAIDSMWGFDKIRVKKNEVFELTDAGSAKYERKAMKEQKDWLEELEGSFIGEEDDTNHITTMTLPDQNEKSRESDIHVHDFTITFAGQVLLENANLKLVTGRRYGLVGRNGVGKTTLLRHMATFDIEGFPRHHRILHVKQEAKATEESVLQVVIQADIERNMLVQKEKDLLAKQQSLPPDSIDLIPIVEELNEVYARMEEIGANTAESRAATILSGLQFTEEMQQGSVASLSGGWRMRVSIAGALFISPDVLMLDEPTNHLDLDAVIWLGNYLLNYKNTVLIVSHDRAFLNEVCTDIIHFKNKKLNYYKGNFDSFVATRREALLVQQRQHESQQIKLNHMQDFVDKFRFNAKRASLVQSRIKAIEKETVVEAVEEDETFSFSFYDAGELGRPIIQVEGVTFGYDKNKPLFQDVHLGIDQATRVALVGPNGVGKSTLLGLIQGKLLPTEGVVKINPQLRLAIFTQHHMDSMDISISPLRNMLLKWPKSTEPELRAHLGRFEIHGNDALKPMKFLSGGQKSRVAFACLTFAKPHVVILDEPTNHLDMEAIEALANALKGFKGGVVVISHDQYFIEQICDEIWMVGNQTVKPFNGSFAEYKKKIAKKH